jgi:hypothetical protein
VESGLEQAKPDQTGQRKSMQRRYWASVCVCAKQPRYIGKDGRLKGLGTGDVGREKGGPLDAVISMVLLPQPWRWEPRQALASCRWRDARSRRLVETGRRRGSTGMAAGDVNGRVAGLSSARCVGGAWNAGGGAACGACLPLPTWRGVGTARCESMRRRALGPSVRDRVLQVLFLGSCHGCVWVGWHDGLGAEPVHPSQKRVYLGKATIDMRSNPVGPHPFMQSIGSSVVLVFCFLAPPPPRRDGSAMV